MPAVKPREKIKKRFIQAVDIVSQERYPEQPQTDIIKSLGLAPSNYYKMRVAAGLFPTLDQCYELCSRYKISAEWLLKGEGEMKSVDMKKAGPVELIKAALTALENGAAVIKTRKKG